MQIRFLLGPAGSGKSFRCLAEIRAALQAAPEGPPLILLAPKQATFQVERQLLGWGGAEDTPALQGYTRLRILSFERLAEFVFEQLGAPLPELLSEEGRVMVLRALLEQKRGELQIFRATARLPGFARQLSELLRELQHHHLEPARLESLADAGDKNNLHAKLRDLALLARAYSDWLKTHRLEDNDRLLDLAADLLISPHSGLKLEAVWLDGFAQMTPQERRLLGAVIRRTDVTTLAFCIDAEPRQSPPWHTSWSCVGETFMRCRDAFAALPGAEIKIETLARNPARTRFENPALAYLEKNWQGRGRADDVASIPGGANLAELKANGQNPEKERKAPIRMVACADPEAEVEFAAREIIRFVRENRSRFCDVAVLLRSLNGYDHAIRRIFKRYDIPFFLDQRRLAAHHPLAELTRYALRVVARGWEHDDWFGALKTGLVLRDDSAVDRLENEALARGWRGRNFWLGKNFESDVMIELREKIIPPFERFADSLAVAKSMPTGPRLASALRELWDNLDVPDILEKWDHPTTLSSVADHPPIHAAVWDQMAGWLNNLEHAFESDALALGDWLQVVEAGLGNLSVGVIPPALDQVLVGAIDRSRNPDLQAAFLLGANEGIFPAPPAAPPLLTRRDREELAAHNALLGPDYQSQIGMERFYGYIACTRPRRQLVLTFARRNSEGRELNPSSFISHLQILLPDAPIEQFSTVTDWRDAEHQSEIWVPFLQSISDEPPEDVALPSIIRHLSQGGLGGRGSSSSGILQHWRDMNCRNDTLSPRLAEEIYGLELRTSVSGLEDFAACPFKFFAGHGLRALERSEFEMDPREKGSFQHAILSEFHLHLRGRRKAWRDLSPAEARALVREIGQTLLPGFRDGLFLASPARRFAAEMLIEGLERLMETLIGWTAQYQFDPVAVETGFGLPESRLPAWRIDLDGRHALLLRGRIDRVDICPLGETGEALGVVIDYKSGARELDKTLLHHGLELQLLAYLGVLAQLKRFDEAPAISRIIPAGAFFVSLRAGGGSVASRDEERDNPDFARSGFQHRGRFDGGHLDRFDRISKKRGDQFRYAKKDDGSFAALGNEAMPTAEFRALVARIEDFLRRYGAAIFAGQTEVSPYRLKTETACDFCFYRPVCRFDPWTQMYRVLRPPKK